MSDQDQLNELRDAFTTMDKDGNGYIEKRELKNLLIALGESPSDKDVDDMFKAADTNGDGQISFGDNLIDFNDFKQLLKNLDNRLTDRDILEVMSVCDADSDGALNYEEFVHFLRAEKVKDFDDDLEYSISELQM